MALDQNTEFVTKDQETGPAPGSFGSISSARVRRAQDIQNLQNGEGAEYYKLLDDQIEALKDQKGLRESELALIDKANKLLKDQEKLQLNKLVDYKKYLELLEESFKMTEKLGKVQDRMNRKTLQSIDDEKKRNKLKEKFEEESYERAERYYDLLEKAKEYEKNNEEANKNRAKAFTDSLHKLKDEVGKLAVIKGVGDLTSGMFDKSSSSSFVSTYKNASAQFGLSTSEFNSFKNSLTMQLAKSDNFFNFGWKDTAEYISKLGELGITGQEMAEQQYLAVVQGTKYLGLTTETQAKILKIARNTNNMDLLNETNKTMVQIMNSQLGVSKEQLNQMASNAADVADISTFLGGNGSSIMQGLIKVQAAVEKEYGKGTAESATNILKSIMSSPSNNAYLNNGYLGTAYGDIVRLIQNGQADEAYKLIISSIKNSRATQAAGSNLYAMEAMGTDANVMTIANSKGSMSNVDKNIEDINNSSSDIAQTIREFNKDWSDKILNAGSNILSLLPFSEVLTLQNAYYALALVELCVKIPSFLGTITTELAQIATNTGMSAASTNVGQTGSFANLLSKHGGKIMTGMLAITSILSFMSAGSAGKSKAESWGTGESSAAVGSALAGSEDTFGERLPGNLAKYTTAGAAIGTAVGHPLIGAGIGALVGTIMSIFGGEKVANGIDDTFGRRSDLGGATSLPYSSPVPNKSNKNKYTGVGGPIGSSDFPWSYTSKFGERSYWYKGKLVHDFHKGIDLAYAEGTPIGANNAGTVVSSGKAGSGGNSVVIDSGDGYEQVYYHLKSPSHLRRGDVVNLGQLIGYMGMTGQATGPHLHIGIRKKGGEFFNPVNSINSELFNPTEHGYASSTNDNDSSSAVYNQEGHNLLESIVSADTEGNPAAYSGIGGPGGNDDVIEAINNGFLGLNDKLEELATRQDSQEEVLRALSSQSRSSNLILRY